MAHVLAVQRDAQIGEAVAVVLSAYGHPVAQVNAGELMYQALLAAPQPVVAVYYTTMLYRSWRSFAGHEGQQDGEDDLQLPEHPWQAMLRQADTLQRHRFIETRIVTLPPPEDMQPFYDQFGVTILTMPVPMNTVVSVVVDTASRLA